MNFKELVEKIESSEEFKKFISEKPGSELCVGFFVIDFISNDSKNSIDYKHGDKVYTFDIKDDLKIKITEDELIKSKNHPDLEKINPDIKVEVEELKSIAGIRALDEGISAKFNKIIAVLQKLNAKETWNLTCMLDGLIILNILVDAFTGEIIKFERKSMMDLIKKK